MLYRILMRLAAVLVVIPLLGLVLAIAMSPGPVHLHTDAAGLTLVFGPAALVAALAWIFKPRWRGLLPLLPALQMHVNRRTALRALAWLGCFHRLSLGERQVELVSIVLGVAAPGAIDAHPNDYRDPAVHGGEHAVSKAVA